MLGRRPTGYDRPPFVARRASPPGGAVGAARDIGSDQVAVTGRVPLGRDAGVENGEVSLGGGPLSCTVRTPPFCPCPAGNDRLPFVASWAAPPNPLVAGWLDVGGGEVAVALEVPLSRQIWSQRRQRIHRSPSMSDEGRDGDRGTSEPGPL